MPRATGTLLSLLLCLAIVTGCHHDEIVEELENYGVKREWLPFAPSQAGPADTNYTVSSIREAPEWQVTQLTATPFTYRLANQSKSGPYALRLSNDSSDARTVWLWRNELTDNLVGHKVRFSAYIKPENWDGTALISYGIWRKILNDVKIDTFRGTLINGKWTKLSIEFDVDPEDPWLSVGLAFTGKGAMWVDECTLEKIGKSKYGSAPRTIALYHKNLGFDDGFTAPKPYDPDVAPYARVAPWGGYLDEMQYRFALDSTVAHSGKHSGALRSVSSRISTNSVASYDLQAELVQGHRVRFSVWMKADSVNGVVLLAAATNASDTSNYENRKLWDLVGTTEWKRYSVELDIPEKASGVRIGPYFTGTGTICIDDLTYEKIAKLPTSPNFVDNSKYFAPPKNLGFEGE